MFFLVNIQTVGDLLSQHSLLRYNLCDSFVFVFNDYLVYWSPDTYTVRWWSSAILSERWTHHWKYSNAWSTTIVITFKLKWKKSIKMIFVFFNYFMRFCKWPSEWDATVSTTLSTLKYNTPHSAQKNIILIFANKKEAFSFCANWYSKYTKYFFYSKCSMSHAHVLVVCSSFFLCRLVHIRSFTKSNMSLLV